MGKRAYEKAMRGRRGWRSPQGRTGPDRFFQGFGGRFGNRPTMEVYRGVINRRQKRLKITLPSIKGESDENA